MDEKVGIASSFIYSFILYGQYIMSQTDLDGHNLRSVSFDYR